MKRYLAALAIVITACGGGNSAPSVDAAKVLHDGAAAMAQWKTVAATLKMSKGTVSLQGFALVSAKTSVRLPSESDTTYTVKEQDILFSLEVVITGGKVYVHLPLSNLQEAPASQAAAFPDMAKLFDPTTGLPAIIPQGTNPRYVSTDQVSQVACYQIATTYTAEQVHGLLSELSSNGPVAARVWVGVSDHQFRKAVLDGAFGDNGTEAAVEVDITSFDAAVTITSPPPP
ncbi:MAG TPA: LppX_LprAFG lipoprotein [Candidatus Dormibacteraeota bacterium]|nr:LppX_LprAFG lipoprotein [Candidatus Dormibacteraeota bacterium]